jgi:predicted ATPase
LHQFTVLIGDNGSGKTSVLEALRLPDMLVQLSGRADLAEAAGIMNAELGGLFRSGTFMEPRTSPGITPARERSSRSRC